MESNEVQELHEHAEHAQHDRRLMPVTFTMSVLAVLVATVTLLGHRAHTHAVLMQARASDQWAYYQAKNIRKTTTDLVNDLLAAGQTRDPQGAQQLRVRYQKQSEKWAEDLEKQREQATDLEREVAVEQRKANRFDLGEALLEIALVITSVTLLTRQFGYWYVGMLFGAGGVASAIYGLLVH